MNQIGSGVSADGEDLYRVVETYSSFGAHRTGTVAETDTAEWVGELLNTLGGTVEHSTFTVDLWTADTALTLADGTAVPHDAVFYSDVGSTTTRSVEVIDVDRSAASGVSGLDPYLDGASPGDALVFALNGPDDDIVQCNRAPVARSGPPAVIIPGNWSERLTEGAELRFDASLAPGVGRNLTATMGAASARPIVITTPLSGWTTCAGERGTGLAVALAMAAELAKDHHVTFVACGGHELGHIGLARWLDANDVRDRPTIHLGASVGAVDRTGELDPARQVLTTVTGDVRFDIDKMVRAGGWTLIDRQVWMGEGASWRAAGAEVLSFLGSSTYFHCLGDVPAAATSPDALRIAHNVALAAARRFLEG